MLKQILSFLKEYLSIIAVVPLILGGVWQILSLALISPSYIRFFSISQQISDGLLILFALLIMYVGFVFTSLFFKELSAEKWAKRANSELIFYIVQNLLRALLAFGIVYVFLLRPLREGETIKLGYVLVFIIFVGGFFSSVMRVFVLLKALIEKRGISFNSLYPRMPTLLRTVLLYMLSLTVAVSALVILSGLIIGTVKAVEVFHTTFSTPQNLKNIESLLNKYQLKYKNVNRDSIKILYMNDKYIFIKDSSKIQIVKFDYMFEDSK